MPKAVMELAMLAMLELDARGEQAWRLLRQVHVAGRLH